MVRAFFLSRAFAWPHLQMLRAPSVRFLNSCPSIASATRVRYCSGPSGNEYFGGEKASAASMATFHAWHSSLRMGIEGTGDPKAVLRPHVSDQCIFKPPTYFKPWVGGDEFVLLMDTVGSVFGSSFVYGRAHTS